MQVTTMLYDFFTQISNFLSKPFMNMAYTLDGIPLLYAFILGLIGALAPCQFTANIGAVALYGNKSIQNKMAWTEVIFFSLGKIVVFTSLGMLVWLIGQEFQQSLFSYFLFFRRAVGPVMVVIGLFLAGFIRMHWTVKLGEIPKRFMKKGKLGSFLMGASFSLGFCPTMFVLFFVTLMPIVLSSPYGLVLPSVFGIGTSLPLIIAFILIWYLGFSGSMMKKGRKLGFYVQRTAGWLMIVLGIIDTLTYWSFWF